jgi:hypothetical protein
MNEKICASEEPRHAWPESMVNVKDRIVLDLGCGLFGNTHLFKKGERMWNNIQLNNMMSTSEWWLKLGAKMVIGLDINKSDIEALRETIGSEKAIFLNEPVVSWEQIKGLVEKYNVDVIKSDTEGFETVIIDAPDEEFKIVKEYYIEVHHWVRQGLVEQTIEKCKRCGYTIRDTLYVTDLIGPLCVFAYK